MEYNCVMRLYRTSKKSDVRKLKAFIKSFQDNRFPPQVVRKVGRITGAVRRRGDAALISATRLFDGVRLSKKGLRVPASAMRAAWNSLGGREKQAMKTAWKNILAFHEKQMPRAAAFRGAGGVSGWVVRPIERVGIHVPGGAAPLVSTLLMLAGPARVAGVRSLVMISPPRSKGTIASPVLAAAWLTGIREVYRVGGAQGVAALVYGTQTIPAVDKVLGPGNIYVQAAKWITQGGGGLEGPSELVVLADEKASASGVASDLIAQAEHTGNELVVLITTSPKLVCRVLNELRRQLSGFPRARQAADSLLKYGTVVLARSVSEGAEIANLFAAEHLEIATGNPHRALKMIRNAGTILLGNYSPVAAEDYAVGPNHILPTAGTARHSSGLGVRDFVRVINVSSLTRKGLGRLKDSVATLARMEGLEGHARSVEVRRD